MAKISVSLGDEFDACDCGAARSSGGSRGWPARATAVGTAAPMGRI